MRALLFSVASIALLLSSGILSSQNDCEDGRSSCFSVDASGLLPNRISLESEHLTSPRQIRVGAAEPLDFITPYRSGVMYQDASLLAAYGGQNRVIIPLQLHDEMTTFSVPLPRKQEIKCNYSTVLRELSSQSPSMTIRFERYISSQILGRRMAEQNCGSGMEQAAARVWFDRSYEIATRYEFIDLDTDAISHAQTVGLGDYINPYLLDYNYLEVSRMLDKARALRATAPPKADAYYGYIISEIERDRSFGNHWARTAGQTNQLSDIRQERSAHQRRMAEAEAEAQAEASENAVNEAPAGDNPTSPPAEEGGN